MRFLLGDRYTTPASQGLDELLPGAPTHLHDRELCLAVVDDGGLGNYCDPVAAENRAGASGYAVHCPM